MGEASFDFHETRVAWMTQEYVKEFYQNLETEILLIWVGKKLIRIKDHVNN